jgi:polyisoprenoid-binding protein YceI
MTQPRRVFSSAAGIRALFLVLPLFTSCGQSAAPPAGDGPIPIPSGTYAIDTSHTYVTFSYMHQGLSYPLLRATDIDGELELDSASMDKSAVSVSVGVDSIRTNMDYFDKELASRKFFHAEKYPYINFTTHSYETISDHEGTLTGFVTIRDITKPLVLSVKINGAMNHPMQNIPVIGFTASGSLDRADFGLDRFVPLVANKVEIKIEAEFLQGSNEGSAAAAQRAADATANADPVSLEIVASADTRGGVK